MPNQSAHMTLSPILKVEELYGIAMSLHCFNHMKSYFFLPMITSYVALLLKTFSKNVVCLNIDKILANVIARMTFCNVWQNEQSRYPNFLCFHRFCMMGTEEI